MSPIHASQYRVVQAIPLIPCGLAFIGSYFIKDNPRWLASKGREEEAITSLRLLRGNSSTHDIESELFAIKEQLADRKRTLADVKTIDIVKEILTIPTYRKRFILALIMQTVAQWSGGNGITYYIPEVSIICVS
jgi:hypothetical protein